MITETRGTEAAILSQIEETAASSPERIAVRGPDATLSYGELSDHSERLARRLRALGVRPGDLVGQCVKRSAGLVVAALGIFKAGAAYVAIDPAYPEERIRWMLEDSGAVALVTDAGNTAHFDRPVVALAHGDLALGAQLSDAERTQALPGPPLATDLAYVVYTSGSTGRPKGVAVEHSSLANLIAWHRGTFALGPDDRCTQIASPGFDAAVWEIWPSLTSGSAIHVVPDDLRSDPAGLRDWLVAEAITVTFVPTAVAEVVIGLSWPDTGSLRYLLTGGDALTRRPAANLGFTVVNNYGLSETTVVATSGVITPEGDGPPSIGRAIAGVQTAVVDERLEPVSPGVEGELVVGGAAVGRGYLNLPKLTAERFPEHDLARWCRTGDRVRVRAGGEIEFLGRLDDQLSIRGFRVEPGEIAGVLNCHPAITASVAVAAGSSSADTQLVAYVVGAATERPDPEQLTAFLATSIPDYMHPSRYVWLEQLPLTAHGKVDRDALPEPAAGVTGKAGVAVDPDAATGTETETETAVAAVVAELLELDTVGIDENFFLLGGHSMLGAQLTVRLGDLFGADISLRYLFDHPTPAEIAAEVQRQVDGDQGDNSGQAAGRTAE